jgi:MFS family permease
MGARLAENGVFYLYSVFMLVYVTEQLKLPRALVLNGMLLATVCELVAIPAFGALSDRIGRRPVYMGGALFSVLFAFPFFWLLDTQQPGLIGLAIVLGLALGHGAMYGPQASFFSELFGTRVRYSGASLGYQLASVFAGGLSPLIATSLLQWTGGKPWPIALYMMAMAPRNVGVSLFGRRNMARRSAQAVANESGNRSCTINCAFA